jgi:hypothetical protein
MSIKMTLGDLGVSALAFLPGRLVKEARQIMNPVNNKLTFLFTAVPLSVLYS